MARVPDMTVDQLAEADRDLLKRNIALHRALTNSPNAARAFSGLGQFIRYGSKLDPRLREMAILQVGWLARSPYEWSHHVKIGYDFGVTDDGSFYYVMELLTGRDLASLVAEFGPLPSSRVIFLLRQVCHSLAEAHSRIASAA